MHALPLRFVIEEEGLFTTGGARVKRIGRMSASEAIAAVMPVAHGDNEWQKREVAAGYLAIAEVLHARGVSGKLDETGVETEEVGGRGVPSHRHPAAPGVAATGAAPREPWSYRVQGDAVVFEYNEVANRPGETLAEFVARMFDVIEREPVGKLIGKEW